MPSDIDPTPYTHINFAFALIDKDGKVTLSLSNDTILFDQLKDVRDNNLNSDIELWIAVGGYAVGSAPFAKLAATQQGRKTFIDSACAFMDKYGFKGMDLDWEYPAATDTGGTTADTANMVSLVKEYREECKKKGLSVTFPGGTCRCYPACDFKAHPSLKKINLTSCSLYERIRPQRSCTICRLV